MMKKFAKIITLMLIVSMFSTCIYATEANVQESQPVPPVGNEEITDETAGGTEDEIIEEPEPVEYVSDLVHSKSEFVVDEEGNETVKLYLSWEINEAVEGLEGVDVALYSDPECSPEKLVEEKTVIEDKEVVFEGLSKATPYYAVASPYSKTGEEKVFGKTIKGVAIYLEKPEIAETKIDGTIVEMTITPIDGASKYVVSYATAGVEKEEIFTETTFALGGLSQNSAYDLKVKAVFEVNDENDDAVYTSESEWSEVVSVDTGETVLKKPALALAAYNKGAILTWDKGIEATGYEIWRSYNNNKSYKLIKTVDANTLTYKNTGLTVNKKYYYKVRAIRVSDDSETLYSEYSSEKSLTAKTYLTSTTIREGYSAGVLKMKAKQYKEGSAYTLASKSKLKRGTSFTILEKRKISGKTMVNIKLSNGKKYWIRAGTITYKAPYTTKDYTRQVKEDFVNKKGYSSSTKYLLFVCNYTQKVYLFTGKKGEWTLKNTYKCATGKSYSRTPRGVFKIHSKSKRTARGSKYVSSFKSLNAFHATPSWSKTLGKPASGGCVRMKAADAKYIYTSIPKKTTVVSY